jgi:hypothetical protein
LTTRTRRDLMERIGAASGLESTCATISIRELRQLRGFRYGHRDIIGR